MKTLNIDALAKVSRTITVGGETYDVQDMTVENFIETTRAADELEAKGSKATFLDQIKMTIATIQRSVPTCPAEKLNGLSIEQLVAISKFLRGELEGEETKIVTTEGGEKK